MRILVSKLGASIGPPRLKGEAGETAGMINHLIRSGHDVVYFGHGVINCPQVVPTMDSRWGPDMPAGLQMEGFIQDRKNLGDFERIILVGGPTATWSRVDNPAGARVFAMGIRYCGPQMNFMDYSGLPTIFVNTDPRTYIKDQTMTTMYKNMPCAILDQCAIVRHRVIGGRTVRQESVYAACESWIEYEPVVATDRREGCCVIAHAAITDGIKDGKERLDAWEFTDLFFNGPDWYGAGFPWETETLEPNNVVATFARYTQGATPGHRNFFYPAKPYQMVAAGTVPRLYYEPGNSCSYGDWKIPFDHELRYGPTIGEHTVKWDDSFRGLFAPDFSALDACLDDPKGDFGGYSFY